MHFLLPFIIGFINALFCLSRPNGAGLGETDINLASMSYLPPSAHWLYIHTLPAEEPPQSKHWLDTHTLPPEIVTSGGMTTTRSAPFAVATATEAKDGAEVGDVTLVFTPEGKEKLSAIFKEVVVACGPLNIRKRSESDGCVIKYLSSSDVGDVIGFDKLPFDILPTITAGDLAVALQSSTVLVIVAFLAYVLGDTKVAEAVKIPAKDIRPSPRPMPTLTTTMGRELASYITTRYPLGSPTYQLDEEEQVAMEAYPGSVIGSTWSISTILPSPSPTSTMTTPTPTFTPRALSCDSDNFDIGLGMSVEDAEAAIARFIDDYKAKHITFPPTLDACYYKAEIDNQKSIFLTLDLRFKTREFNWDIDFTRVKDEDFKRCERNYKYILHTCDTKKDPNNNTPYWKAGGYIEDDDGWLWSIFDASRELNHDYRPCFLEL